ncbi:MAG: hypothetical protein ACRDVC_09970 [Acidimicrobiales bacterium]
MRSDDDGEHWTVVGPLLATDWAGGGLYYVSKVIAESPSVAVMVSDSIIDVTVDSGHQWYQYLNPEANWSMSAHAYVRGAIALRVGPASYAQLPKTSFAIYVLDAAGHLWHRVSQSLR